MVLGDMGLDQRSDTAYSIPDYSKKNIQKKIMSPKVNFLYLLHVIPVKINHSEQAGGFI